MAVTSTNNLKLGSTGSDVIELQKLLNSAGNYGLDEDGSFGEKTLAAVKDYQTNNGLEVDGIVGTNTWAKLTGGNASTTPSTQSAGGFTYATYKPSDTVAQAEALLQQQLSNKPGAYTSTWGDQLNETIAQILNREKFSYDLNEDALYQQYKDQYMMQGQQAMMDTMGQTAALTGGYGNSYAQTAGQQAYQGYLQRLNEVVPELYSMARDQYNQDGQALYDRASLMASMEDQEYGRYRDTLSDYYTELSRLTEDARYKSEQEYGRWADDVNLQYGMYRDQVADKQWQAEFDEAKRQYDQQYELQTKSKKKSSNPTPKPAAEPESTEFNGTTYSEAVAYAKENGVPGEQASMIRTKSEFSRVKANGTSDDDSHKCANYQEYLNYVVDSMIEAYAKK